MAGVERELAQALSSGLNIKAKLVFIIWLTEATLHDVKPHAGPEAVVAVKEQAQAGRIAVVLELPAVVGIHAGPGAEAGVGFGAGLNGGAGHVVHFGQGAQAGGAAFVADFILALAADDAQQNSIRPVVAADADDVAPIEAIDGHLVGFAGHEGAVEQGRAVGRLALAGAVEHPHPQGAAGQPLNLEHLALVGAHHVHAPGQQLVIFVHGLWQLLNPGFELAVQVLAG